MRDYEEVAMSVLRRRDEQLAKDKHRRVIILKAGTAALSFCFACAIGIGAWKSGIPGELMKHGRPGGENVIVEETSTTAAHEATDAVSGQKPSEGAAAAGTALAEQTTRTADRTSNDTAVKTSEDKTVKTTAAAEPATRSAAAAQTAKAETGAAQAAPAAGQTAAAAAVQATTPATVQVTVPVTIQVTTPMAEHVTLPAEVPSEPADAGHDVVPVTTDIASHGSIEAMGRSEYMKKVTSFFTAIMAAASVGTESIDAIQARAEAKDNPYIMGALEFAEQYSEYPDDPFARIADGTIDADFNADGIVDEMDSYLMFWYTEYNDNYFAKAPAERIRNSGDIDGNGTVDTRDTELLMKYVLIDKVPTENMFDTAYYYDKLVSYYEAGDDDYKEMVLDEYSHSEMPFVQRLCESGQSIGVTYYIFADKVDSGEFDLDFDEDGSFTIRDIIWCKISEQKTPIQVHFDPMTGGLVESYDYSARVEISPRVERRIDNIRTRELSSPYNRRNAMKISIGGDLSDVIRYYFETHDLIEKMLNNGYYDALIKGAGAYDLARDIVWYQFFTGMISAETVDDYIKGNAYQDDLVIEITDKELEKMRQAVADGTLPQPDADGNGVIDARDYWYSSIYNGDIVWGRAAWQSELPLEVSNFFRTKFDYDQDGISGTERDIKLAQPYLIEKAVEAISERMVREDNIDLNALEICRAAMTYNLYYYEEAYIYGAYDGLDPEKLDKVFMTKYGGEYKAYEAAVKAGTASEPDLDGDGAITENDLSIASAMSEYLCDLNMAEHGQIADPYRYDTNLVTDEVLEYISSNCDYNFDGRSGKMYDMAIAEEYIAGIIRERQRVEDNTPHYIWEEEGYEDLAPADVTEPAWIGSGSSAVKEEGGLPQEAATGIVTEEETSDRSRIAGDANADAKVNVADAVAVLQFISNSEKYPLDENGVVNADCDGTRGITGSDAIAIQRADAGLSELS